MYRGTTGFGESNRKELLGHIGEVDVEDCLEAIQLAKDILGPKKIVIHGKSMGGFLAGHISCRIKPDASVILNAVSNVASIALATDMNEWPFALANNTEPVYPPSSEDIKNMYERSPIAYFHNISCPVFLAAGGSDVRVLPHNTIEMYRILKVLNKDVKLFWYKDDGHGFSIKSTSFDLLVNTFLWILEKIS